jgi:hypothetical protein
VKTPGRFTPAFFSKGNPNQPLVSRHGLRDSANIFFPILPGAEGATSE